MKGLFVIGADSKCGKTYVSAALVAALRRRSIDASYIKPVGCDGVFVDGRMVAPDALFVAKAAGLDDPWDWMSPICLPGPLSPLTAAEACGLSINLSAIEPSLRSMIQQHDFMVVEGSVGLMAPVTCDALEVDLLSRLDLPILVVGRPGVGSISHTLLTLECLKQRGLKCLGFCFSSHARQPGQVGNPANARLTATFTDYPFLGILPYLSNEEVSRAQSPAVLEAGNRLADIVLKKVFQKPASRETAP